MSSASTRRRLRRKLHACLASSTGSRAPSPLIRARSARSTGCFPMSCAIRRDGDTVDDATVRWPEERPQRAFGEISLREIAANNASEQQNIIFDSIPRVDGIEASGDPLFEPRANIYLMSGRRRRAVGGH